MASFSELFIQKAMQSNASDPDAGVAGAMQVGVQLAQLRQQTEARKQELQMRQQEIQQAKIEKFVVAVEKGQQYAGKASSNYYTKFLPQYKNALGLNDVISDEALSFVSSDPANLGRFKTLVADVRAGSRTAQEAFAELNDPVKFADITPSMMNEVGEAQKTFLGNEAAAARQRTQIESTGRVEVAKKVGADYAAFRAGGGEAGIERKLKGLYEVEKGLQDGSIQTGKVTQMLPGLGSERGQTILNPTTKAAADKVRSAISLKGNLDSQFSAKEAEIQFNRAFDMALPPEENLQKVQDTIRELEAAKSSKIAEFRASGFESRSAGGGKAARKAAPPKADSGIPQLDSNPALKKQIRDAINMAPTKLNGYAQQLGVDPNALWRALQGGK